MSEGREVDLERHVHNPGVSSAVCRAREANGEVPAAPKEGTGKEVPGNLDENGGGDEDGPRVHPTRVLTRLEELTETEELGLELLGERGGKNDGHEDTLRVEG